MSHLIQSSILVKDLDALRSAAASFGATMEKASTFTSYTGDGNPCEHRIKLPGVNYQVGVVKDKAGHYVLSHDPYGGDGYGRHDGHKLEAKFGKNLMGLVQSYSRQVIVRAARAKGYLCSERKLANGSIQLQITGA